VGESAHGDNAQYLSDSSCIGDGMVIKSKCLTLGDLWGSDDVGRPENSNEG